jgi:hypothetical protein
MAGLLLRGTAAWAVLVGETVAGRLEWVADRVDPPVWLSLSLGLRRCPVSISGHCLQLTSEGLAECEEGECDRASWDAPPSSGDSRLINEPTPVRAQAMAEDPDAYWERVHAERATEARERGWQW